MYVCMHMYICSNTYMQYVLFSEHALRIVYN